jgi:hypothetical protein
MVGMPAVLAAYKAIGKEIVSGRQGEIDFSQFGLHGGGNSVTTSTINVASSPTANNNTGTVIT